MKRIIIWATLFLGISSSMFASAYMPLTVPFGTSLARFTFTSGNATSINAVTLNYWSSGACGGTVKKSTTWQTSPYLTLSQNLNFGVIAEGAGSGSGGSTGIGSIQVLFTSNTGTQSVSMCILNASCTPAACTSSSLQSFSFTLN